MDCLFNFYLYCDIAILLLFAGLPAFYCLVVMHVECPRAFSIGDERNRITPHLYNKKGAPES